MRINIKDFDVLIIDDTPDQIHLVARILNEAGYKVRVLVDVNKLDDMLQNKVPDLILLDILMPIINGIDLCKYIKKNPIYSSIPIIFLTAVTDSNMIINAFAAGAHDYVSKPVNPKELLARVDVHIQLKNKTEKLEEAYKEIENFNHMVCHDIKSPLLAINNLVSIIKEEMFKIDDSTMTFFLDDLRSKVTETTMLIEKLAQLSQITSNPLTKDKICIYDIFNEVYQSLLQEYPDRKVDYTIDAMPIVVADKILIKQVIYNAMSNAFKYSSRNDNFILKISYKDNKDEHIFIFSDNGVGFNMEKAGMLFSMFYRLHSENDFPGSGTGLAIAKKIILRHSGRVWIESEEYQGTRFYFTLPK